VVETLRRILGPENSGSLQVSVTNIEHRLARAYRRTSRRPLAAPLFGLVFDRKRSDAPVRTITASPACGNITLRQACLGSSVCSFVTMIEDFQSIACRGQSVFVVDHGQARAWVRNVPMPVTIETEQFAKKGGRNSEPMSKPHHRDVAATRGVVGRAPTQAEPMASLFDADRRANLRVGNRCHESLRSHEHDRTDLDA
jgi:hypothetical protein